MSEVLDDYWKRKKCSKARNTEADSSTTSQAPHKHAIAREVKGYKRRTLETNATQKPCIQVFYHAYSQQCLCLLPLPTPFLVLPAALLELVLRPSSSLLMLKLVSVRGTPYASDARSSSASASDSRLPSASAPATSPLFRNVFGRMTSYATRSRPASAPDRMMSRDVA